MSQEIDDIDRFEREADRSDDEAGTEPDADLDLEAPEADTAEQHVELLQHDDEPVTGRPGEDSEADPADAAEQRRVVDLDEDDYR